MNIRRLVVFTGLLCVFGLSGGLTTTASAQTKWDMALPWGPTEFHVLNARKFSDRVREVTGGEVQISIHPGGSLGVKANESLRAVADGVVPLAEYAAFQNVGEVPMLGVESLPFLINDYAQLRVMHSIVRPVWESSLEKRNQKLIYSVPWPSQNFFTKKPINTLADLKGVKMRTYDKNTADMVQNIGMVPLQMNNPDIVPSLASGKLDAVMTSGTTAVAQKYWEFLKHVYNTNHLWASNIVSVNAVALKKLSAQHQAAILKAGRDLEPEFWTVSEGEHSERMGQLRANGMTVEPAKAELLEAMRRATRPLWDEFTQKNGPEAAKMLSDYRAKTGK